MNLSEKDQKVQFIVHSWLDVEAILGVSQKPFAIQLRSPRWVMKRLAIFKEYTLRSLLNQTFDNFRIFLFCGLKHREITEAFDFGTDRVERFYDFGKDAYAKMRHPFVSVMRIDSDDLFHKRMMEEIRNRIQPHPTKMTSFAFRKVIQWNVLQNFMTDFFLRVSPFTNHVLPRKLYRDWSQFRHLQFGGYRSAPEIVMRPHLVCIVRHRDNVTWSRVNKNPASDIYKRQEFSKRKNVIASSDRMVAILKEFGIPEEMVRRG